MRSLPLRAPVQEPPAYDNPFQILSGTVFPRTQYKILYGDIQIATCCILFIYERDAKTYCVYTGLSMQEYTATFRSCLISIAFIIII